MDLTDAQWNAVESYFPVEERKAPGRCGARPWTPARSVLNDVLWVLRTGAPWKDLPERYPPYQTCHRRFQGWVKKGVLPRVLAGLRKDLCGRGGIEDVEGYIDGTYVPAKKGAVAPGSAAPAMRRRSWRLQTALVFRSLSLLEQETDMTPLSPIELSTLLSWRTFHPG